MNLVLDGYTLAIDIDTPAANLLGFEHAPRDEAEEVAVAQAVARLRDAAAVFGLPQAAQCTVEAVEVESALLGHEHEHEEANEAPSRHAQHDADEHQAAEGLAHADIAVSYRFHCAQPQALDGINVKLFTLFPATEVLEVQQITPHGQGAAELTADAPYLRF
jgi:hypothetical protein